jgi:site-specific recombinase XerC
LGSNCEVAVFADLLFYPNVFGVPKWFTALPLSRGTLLACIDHVIAKLRQDGLSVASINRRLEVLRRLLKLAMEWGKVEKALPKVEMLPGENHRDRVLSEEEETRYLEGATAIGNTIQKAYERALNGIRATMQ